MFMKIDAIQAKLEQGIPVRLSSDGVITPVTEIREQTIPTGLPTLPVIFPEGK